MARRRYQDPKPKLRKGKTRWSWYFSFRVDVIQEGRIVREQITESFPWVKGFCDTQKLAQREVDARMAKIQSPDYRARPDVKFAEFAERWKTIVLSQQKPSTQLGDGSRIKKHLTPHFGQVKLKDLNGMMVQEFASTYPCSPKSMRNLVGLLRVMWKSAQAWDYVPASSDPFKGLKLRKAEKLDRPFFTEQQIRLILQQAGHHYGEQYRTFFWLAAETGMRAGELCGLRVEDLDVALGVVQVRQSVWRGREQTPKTQNAVRSFAISPGLSDSLNRIGKRGVQSALLFKSATGSPLDANMLVKRKLHRILSGLGIPRAGLHAFRHGNASMMDRLDAPMKTRMSRMGHGSMEMTNRYTHSIGEDDRRVANQLGDMFAPQLTERVQ